MEQVRFGKIVDTIKRVQTRPLWYIGDTIGRIVILGPGVLKLKLIIFSNPKLLYNYITDVF